MIIEYRRIWNEKRHILQGYTTGHKKKKNSHLNTKLPNVFTNKILIIYFMDLRKFAIKVID